MADRADPGLVQLRGATSAARRALSTTRASTAETHRTHRAEPDRPTAPPATATTRPGDPWERHLAACFGAQVERAAATAHGEPADAVLREQFARRLELRLVRLAARVLVLELSRARRQGRLTGADPAERFADFVRQLVGGSELAAVFRRYPVLSELVDRTCRQAVAARRELMARSAADRHRVVQTLLGGREPGPVAGIESVGDPHRGGRSVTVLGFADGRRVVYKPRPLGLHRWFNELVRWLDGHIGFGLRTVTLVPGDGYGWLEFVPNRACADLAGVNRFYRRQGALLALLYVLDGSDMHFENLIAAGDQPVLVDVETLFSPAAVPPTVAGPDPAATALGSSVHRTGILPLLLVGEHGVFDVSGVGGDAGGSLPAAAPYWADAGLDTMRLVRRPAPAPGARNRARIGDEVAEPRDHRAALLAGFGIAYDAIAAHREELTRLVERGSAEVIRFVPRPTHLYAALLEESTHPDVLRVAADRERLFGLLWEDSPDELRRRLVPHEIAELTVGDVPLFTSRADSRDVWAADGSRLAGVFDDTGLSRVKAKIATLGEVDRERQDWLIAAALSTRPRPTSHHSGPVRPARAVAAPPDPERLLAAATGIADELVARAISNRGRSNWLGLELVDDRHWAVLPLGAGLSNGYCGTALFLAQMAALTGATRYVELAHDAIRPIPRLLESWAADPDLAGTIGAGFHGFGGICYALARLGELLGGVADVETWLTTALELAEASSSGRGDWPGAFPSFAEGAAGGLAAMLAVGVRTGQPTARRLAVRYAEVLLTAIRTGSPVGGPEPRFGFARGYAGLGWALLRFTAAGGDDRHHQAGLAALRLDRKGQARRTAGADPAWCSGEAGRLLAAAACSKPPDSASYLASAYQRPVLQDLGLCHGELGAVEPLAVLAHRGHATALAVLQRRTGLVLGAVEQDGVFCGPPDGIGSPGLLTGLAGVGYGLLRLGFGGTVPSVLLLEPSDQVTTVEGVLADDRTRPTDDRTQCRSG